MPEIRIIKVWHSGDYSFCNYDDKDVERITQETTDTWETISNEDLQTLRYWMGVSNSKNYGKYTLQIVERLDQSTTKRTVADYLEEARQQQKLAEERKALAAERAKEIKLKKLNKQLENERKTFELLKKKFEKEQP